LYLSQFPQIKIVHMPGKLNIIPDALSRLQAADSEASDEDGADIYDTLELQASMSWISDDLIDRLQKGYNEDPFSKNKFGELKRQFAKSGSLPVEYNNLVLEDTELSTFTPLSTETDPVLPGTRRYLLYLRNGSSLRSCIPKSLFTPFLDMVKETRPGGYLGKYLQGSRRRRRVPEAISFGE
jgi:hypothetical protein